MVKDVSINCILLTMPLRNGKSDCKRIWELKTDQLILYQILLFAGLWTSMSLERIYLWDTFVSILESPGQKGAIDWFSPSANFCQVDWCSWQRSPLRGLMNKPMRIFNNRKACRPGKILLTGGITQSLPGKSLVMLWRWVTHARGKTQI